MEVMAACLLGMIFLRARWRKWGEFVVGSVLAVASFALMIATVGRQYVRLWSVGAQHPVEGAISGRRDSGLR